MIAYIQGKLVQIDPAFAIVDCGGIGYLAKISLNTYTEIRKKSTVKLHTYLQVREDAHTLYGFQDLKEKTLFEQLISVSGVGGNTALVILSSIQMDDLCQAIQSEDVQSLKRVKGIGAKTAGRIILDLKDKIKYDGLSPSVPEQGIAIGQKRLEAISALSNLGLPKSMMEKRVDQILKKQGPEISVAEVIKLALKNP